MQAKKECLSMFIFWVVTPCGLIGRHKFSVKHTDGILLRNDGIYSGRKMTESLENFTVRGEKDGKSKGGARWPTV